MAKRENSFTLDFWEDGEWLVGRLRERPGVMSQGKNMDELVENIIDAFKEMSLSNMSHKSLPVRNFKSKQVEIAC